MIGCIDGWKCGGSVIGCGLADGCKWAEVCMMGCGWAEVWMGGSVIRP